MAYDSLKNIIRQYIKTNGEQEITGQIMQNVLIEMVNNYPSTEGYIRATLSNLANGDILVYDSVGAWYNTPMSSFLAGYATQLWVNQQGYVTSSALAGYIHPTITDLANGDILIWDSVGAWVNTPLDTTISGFGYVKSTGSVAYATSAGSANILAHSVYENPAHALANGDMLVYDSGTGWTNVETSSILSGYATQSWVTSQGYLTSSALNGYIHPTLTNLANGDILVYDSGVNWVNTPLSSFGFATQTWVGQQGYITSSALNGYATQSWVTSQGYIQPTLTGLSNGDILIYDSVGAWVNVPISSFLSGYATQSWVNQQGFSKFNPTISSPQNRDILVYESGGAGWLNASLDTLLSVYATQSWVTSQGYITASALNGYATEAWVGQQGYITSSALNGYATQSWVNQQGFLTSSALNGYIHPTLSNLEDGNILVYDAQGGNWVNTSWPLTGYATQSWVQQQGYITASALNGYATQSWTVANGIAGFGDYASADHILYLGDVNLSKWSFETISIIFSNGFFGNHHASVDIINIAADGLSAPKLSRVTLHSQTEQIFYYTVNNNKVQLYVAVRGGNGYGIWSYKILQDNIGLRNFTPSFTPDYNMGTATVVPYGGTINYATTAGGANHAKILGHEVYENTYHSLSNGDTLVYDAGTGWLNYQSGLSDIRQKDVINYNAEPTFEAVANAPAIKFTYKDNTYSFRRGIHVGSIAQYWQTTLPETVSMDNDGMLSMKYDIIALLSTISVAKKVSEHERRIVILERENEELRKELAALKSA